MTKPRFKWRHQYDTEADEKEGSAAALHCEDESLTQQHFTDDANLNVIAKRFGLNTIPLAPLDPSMFRDTTQDPDLATILQHQIDAKNNFMQLPAKLRRRFHDSPAELWNFITDPDNQEEALRLGILARIPEATADPAPTAQTATSSNATTTTASDPKNASGGAPTLPPQTPPQTSQKGT